MTIAIIAASCFTRQLLQSTSAYQSCAACTLHSLQDEQDSITNQQVNAGFAISKPRLPDGFVITMTFLRY